MLEKHSNSIVLLFDGVKLRWNRLIFSQIEYQVEGFGHVVQPLWPPNWKFPNV